MRRSDGTYQVHLRRVRDRQQAKNSLRLRTLEQVAFFVRNGYCLRMTPNDSIIAPDQIRIEGDDDCSNDLDEEELDTLDRRVLAKQRKEQKIFREILVGDREVACCTICERQLPVSLLVASHIKQRSKCIGDSLIDRYDLDNFTLMCSLGCDALFESRMIRVVDGVVSKGNVPSMTEDLRESIASVAGNRVKNWNSAGDFYLSGW
ncbi:hypothetical protein RBSWK_05849 [Rhodopirellula baltica SWK14]|uniref:HNH nuclease domain-containing protein n=1 Tax=Rhodopirellula baltica SWK14 TaxID=993516 RepID=L7CAW7_RHOBT|nr:hypothetical protein RBSWK_05849 [Rhodopirellula baltica SWK14]